MSVAILKKVVKRIPVKKGKNKSRKARRRKEDCDSVWTETQYYRKTVTPKRLASRDNDPTQGRKWVRT